MYAEQFRIFSENVTFATRTLHTYLHINQYANKDEKILASLNSAARFWIDYNFIALQTVVIFLGKLFDTHRRAHSIDKLLSSTKANLSYFSKAAIRARHGPFDGIEEYMADVHELTLEDIHEMDRQLRRAKTLWKKIEPLRHKVYAHNELSLSSDLRAKLFGSVYYQDLITLTQILANIREALWHAEWNGRKPDFTRDFHGLKADGEEAAEKLISRLKTRRRTVRR